MKKFIPLMVLSLMLMAGCNQEKTNQNQDIDLPSEAQVTPDNNEIIDEETNVEDEIESETKPEETDSETISQEKLNELFRMDEKVEGTQLYYSDKLGVGFTYLSPGTSPAQTVKITEEGNKIYLHMENEDKEDGQSIEVFEKDPTLILQDAIKEKFLKDIDPADCFVEESGSYGDYIKAIISYPPTNVPDQPFWMGGEKCPENYKKTNGIQFFLTDERVPNKFLFVRLGQAIWAFDGTPEGEGNENGKDWSASLKVVK